MKPALLSAVVRRISIALLIGLLATGVAFAAHWLGGKEGWLARADWVFYDNFFASRPPTSRVDGPVVIVEVDQKSLDEIQAVLKRGWPWPRESWGFVIDYLQRSGARAVAFDVLFSETSLLGPDDDISFAAAIDDAAVPLVFSKVPSGQSATQPTRRFAPPVKRPPTLADVTLQLGTAVRSYAPMSNGTPSLALAALEAAGLSNGVLLAPFKLHYYGPVETKVGVPTYSRISASRLILAAMDALEPGQAPPANLLKDKIVLIGLTAPGLFDLKATPVDSRFHGVQIHATAIDNLLERRQVMDVAPWKVIAIGLLVAVLVALGTIVPRGAVIKTAIATTILVAVVGLSFVLFRGATIRWLPPTLPLTAGLLSTACGLAWSYSVEDRKARFYLKALESSLSPAVAAELSRDPTKLATGGRRAELTVMFTDLHGFTDLTEKLKEKIEPLLNFYLAEMTEKVLALDGTVDKYIGDAIMAFWNAPLDQPDHARLACRAALAVKQREIEITPRLHEMGADFVQTRIGINTGDIVVGFMGSSKKLSYTAIGDPVNLAARLEPANKIYGTQILVAGKTVDLVGDAFLFRQVDLLKVKGKTEGIRVYELLADAGSATPAQRELSARYAALFASYQARDFAVASALLVSFLVDFPDDPPAEALRTRLAYFVDYPPAGDWDGSYEAKTK